jgi:hypothetical protein
MISNPINPARTTPAGPPIETPQLQMLGQNTAEFYVFFGNENDFLKVPNIKFNEVKKYEELYFGVFLDKNNVENIITEAIQTIEFEIDNKGGKLKSEALIAVKENAIMIEDPVDYRYFYCNDDFYMFLKEENKDKPYLALKVDDLKDFQEDVVEFNIDR